MSTTPRPVAVAFDLSEHGRPVLDRAIAFAAKDHDHVLHIITVLDHRAGIAAVPPGGPVDIVYSDRIREVMAARIGDAFQAAAVANDVPFCLHVRIGEPAHEILDLAKEVGADLIFIGTHGYTGIKHLVMGSVAERVVREAGCPVLVVRPKTYSEVALDPIVEIPAHKLPTSRRYLFSYKNSTVIMRPPDWPTY